MVLTHFWGCWRTPCALKSKFVKILLKNSKVKGRKKVMSLKIQCPPPIPTQTARVAKAEFPKGNVYLKMRDEFELFYQDEQFAQRFPNNGQPGLAPWRLALITLMQAAEGLSDRQSADAVRARLDWKYALGHFLQVKGRERLSRANWRQNGSNLATIGL